MECAACKHQWVAVHPVEAEYLECSVCHEMTPAPFISEDRRKLIPSALPMCAVCGWFHELDDDCVEPHEHDKCNEGEEWKQR